MSSSKGIDAFVKFGEKAGDYSQQYADAELAEFYPEHRFRLKIFMDLLAKIQPRKVLDIGCGSGDPLSAILGQGHDAYGFDFSPEMVAQAQRTLTDRGLDATRVSRNNMEDIREIRPGEFDCMVGLGSLYYSRNFPRTMQSIAGLLPEGGNIVFSLRNELFSLFSLNKYSAEFLMDRLMPLEGLSESLRNRVSTLLETRFAELPQPKKFKTIDEIGIYSEYHNPLTVQDEVLTPCGLKLEGVYYYHFHALPPVFEHSDTVEFRRLSAQMESNPRDWRGAFMSSAFIVHASKPRSPTGTAP